jgi:hypothetical protein
LPRAETKAAFFPRVETAHATFAGAPPGNGVQEVTWSRGRPFWSARRSKCSCERGGRSGSGLRWRSPRRIECSLSLSHLSFSLSLSLSISLPLSSLRTEQAFAQADDGAIGGGRGAESGGGKGRRASREAESSAIGDDRAARARGAGEGPGGPAASLLLRPPRRSCGGRRGEHREEGDGGHSGNVNEQKLCAGTRGERAQGEKKKSEFNG